MRWPPSNRGDGAADLLCVGQDPTPAACRRPTRQRHSSPSLMAMALAVAMVACQAATPKPGEKGDPGDPGERGPQGESGTPDNALPMLVKPLPMLYVALAGSGITPDKTAEPIDLGKYFKDDETPTLTYKVKSVDPKDVAEVTIAGGKTKTVGKKAGTATVTISVYDGVNDPIEGTFSVMVVASNVKPVVGAQLSGIATTGGDLAKLAAKLYVDRGASTVTVTSVIYDFGDTEGTTGDEVTFHPKVGNTDTKDDVVSVSVMKGSKPDTWDVTLTPKKAGHQNVEVVVKDKFGSPAVLSWKFQVLVNTKPSVTVPLPNLTIDEDTPITVATYIELAEKDPTQPLWNDPTDDPDEGMIPATSTSEHADYINPASTDEHRPSRTADATCSFSTSPDQDDSTTTANEGSGSVSGGSVVLPRTKVGQYSLSIACRDAEYVAVSTSMITVTSTS